MKNQGTANRFELLLSVSLLSVVSAIIYLLFIRQFGYFNDDWYLMYAAGARGSAVFWDIFAVDRPLRALVMIPAYTLFGPNPLYYNLSSFLFRLIGGLCFFWILRMLWPGNRRMTLWMAFLFLLYPGFLSQPNAIDYLCHLAGLAAGMLSIGLTLQALQAVERTRKVLFYLFSILLGWFYLGQIEWYIGLEFFRFACVLIMAMRSKESTWQRLTQFVKWAFPVMFIPAVFLAWRLFYFTSARGATDVGLQLSDFRGKPVTFLLNFISTLWDDFFDVLFRAWWLPLSRLFVGINLSQWMLGIGITVFVLFLLWFFYRMTQRSAEADSDQSPFWKQEAVWLGLGAIVFGLFPVILVGRSVDFRYFSRYTLVASVGAAILWPLGLSFISNLRMRGVLFGFLIVSASLTHYANGLVKARETEQMDRFWWQVSWRAPQIQQGTTLLANYPHITVEEDYFVWGPANLIYYPNSMNVSYPQPGIYALLINEETVNKILTGAKQDFSDRRSIRTYPNFRNILILTQPEDSSCVQVISGKQEEYSSFEDSRITQIGFRSEAEHIFAQDPFHQPPQIPFGPEPEHNWCFYFEKAALARQLNDWHEVSRLADEALGKGLHPTDQIEWIPFLQAFANSNDIERLRGIKLQLTDPLVKRQACQILLAIPAQTEKTRLEINHLYCSG